MDATEAAQRLLDGNYALAREARLACEKGTWPAFVCEAAPPGPAVFGRGGYARCLALAKQTCAGPRRERVLIVPLCVCRTDETESSEWFAAHGVLHEEQPLGVLEPSPYLADATPRSDSFLACTVDRWTTGTVVRSEFYAPSV
jgi:hypothetical protein